MAELVDALDSGSSRGNPLDVRVILTAIMISLLCTAWFTETLCGHWQQNLRIDKEILRTKTEHQDLVIFENDHFGRVLALDGVVQLTEKDEAIYHEMMTHVPLLAHGSVSSVLVIGGGDGGILREVLKHPSVKRVVLVEIDPDVIKLSRECFPNLTQGAFDDPRVQIVIEDASLYARDEEEQFDVIICDSTDPEGPGAVLFTEEFYGNCKARLRANGIFVNQNGVPFVQPEELSMTLKNRKPHFQHVTFYTASIPSYVGGCMAFGFASDVNYALELSCLQERFQELGIATFYYTPEVHLAAFALPAFIEREIFCFREAIP